MGELPDWPRDDCPSASYHVELVDTRDAAALWRRHQQRVDEIQRARGAGLRPQDSLLLYLCLNRRSGAILAHRGRQLTRLSGVLIAGFMILLMAVVGAILFGLNSLLRTSDLKALIAPVLIVFAGALALAPIPLLALIRSTILPRLPGPPPQPADDLLALVRQEQGENPVKGDDDD
jgi:hypothetical protein